MAVIRRRVRLGLDTLGRVLLQTLHAQPLKGRQGPGTRLNGISRRHEVGRRVGHVGRRVGVLERFLAGIDGPRGDVDLLAHRDVERLEEGVHVLPAVELTEAAELGRGDRHEGVTRAVAVDELLDMGGLDLAAVVDDLTTGIDQSLRQVKGGVVDFGEAERDITADVVLASVTDHSIMPVVR